MKIPAFVGTKCLIVSPVRNDDGNWNGYQVGESDGDCLYCEDPECEALVLDWLREGDEYAQRLAERLNERSAS